jgi:hypothetical protein
LYLLQTLVNCCLDIIDTLGDFVGDEQLFAGNAGLLDGDADFFLGSVHLCAV